MLLICDGNNLAWAGFHALSRAMGAETPEAKTRAALLGLTQSALGTAVRNGEPPATGKKSSNQATFDMDPGQMQTSRLVVCFDEGRPLRRRERFPGYQLSREANSAFRENEPFILAAIGQFIDMARLLPVEVLRGTNTEADDLAAALALQAPQERVRIASTDRDFLQLVGDRVSIYSPVKKLVVSTANFVNAACPHDKDGAPIAFPIERYLDYRVLSGDASDDLPGVPGVGTVSAAKLVQSAPLDDYLQTPSRVSEALGRKSPKLETAFGDETTKEVIARNREMMDLRLAATRYPDLNPYRRTGVWAESEFRAWVKDQRIAALEIESTCRLMERLAAK